MEQKLYRVKVTPNCIRYKLAKSILLDPNILHVIELIESYRMHVSVFVVTETAVKRSRQKSKGTNEKFY